MLIYVDEISERLIYTMEFVFEKRGLTFQLTNDPVYFQQAETKKLNYSERFFENIPYLSPSKLLFDEDIIDYSVSKCEFESEICLAFDKICDPLSAIFYVLSRMEEYSHKKRDKHGRFKAEYSVLHQYGILQKAVCDRWAVAFINYLNRVVNTDFKIQLPSTQIIPTFDIDNTFAFQWKSFFRRSLSYLKDLIRNDKERIIARKMFRSKASNDPYDTYAYIEEIADKGFDVHVFWLLGNYGNYDNNISVYDHRHQNLIKKLSKKMKIGLHPSYKSNQSLYLLPKEKNRLEQILRQVITHSRQHFLKLNLPTTYNFLIENGFTDDYTMGYADEIGFRAGTAKAFHFFDLTQNKKTDFIIHPFVYMDGTLNEYKNYGIEKSKILIAQLYEEVANYGGEFMFIWHNETIGNFGKWDGWKDVLEFTLGLSAGSEKR